MSSTRNAFGKDQSLCSVSSEPSLSDAQAAPNEQEVQEAEFSLESDYGHAHTLKPLWQDRWRWWSDKKTWMRWNGQYWEPATTPEANCGATENLLEVYDSKARGLPESGEEYKRLTKLRKEACTFSRVKNALAYMSGFPEFLTRSDEWDQDPWVLNTQNGVLDLRACKDGNIAKLKLLPHNPNLLCTKITSVGFSGDTLGQKWNDQLNLCLPNKGIQREVNRELGMALHGSSLGELLPIWYGKGANGKSTVVGVIQHVLGGYAGQAAPNLLIKRKHEGHPTEVADLLGYRVVFSSEINAATKLDEAKVKLLTGGDRQKARFMRKDFFDFKQTWITILLSNHRPEIIGTDDGIWRRVRIIPWESTIPREDQKPQDEVIEDLLSEGSTILLWMLRGLADFYRDPNWISDEVQEATSLYRHEQDRVNDFLQGECKMGRSLTISKKDLYLAYQSWSTAQGEDSLSKKSFGKRMLGRSGIAPSRGTGNVHNWKGVKLL